MPAIWCLEMLCPMGVVSFYHPFWTYFTKAKRTKTLYMINTHTHTCINLYYYYHTIFHFFTFRALLLHWGYFPLDLGILSLKSWKFYLLFKKINWQSQFLDISLEWKCWKSLTPKNLRFFMLGSKIRVGFHVHITHSPIAKHHVNTKFYDKLK